MKTKLNQVDMQKQEEIKQPKVGEWFIRDSSRHIIVDIKASSITSDNIVYVSGDKDELSGWDRYSNMVGGLYAIDTEYFIAPVSSLMLELL